MSVNSDRSSRPSLSVSELLIDICDDDGAPADVIAAQSIATTWQLMSHSQGKTHLHVEKESEAKLLS